MSRVDIQGAIPIYATIEQTSVCMLSWRVTSDALVLAHGGRNGWKLSHSPVAVAHFQTVAPTSMAFVVFTVCSQTALYVFATRTASEDSCNSLKAASKFTSLSYV